MESIKAPDGILHKLGCYNENFEYNSKCSWITQSESTLVQNLLRVLVQIENKYTNISNLAEEKLKKMALSDHI